MAAMQIGILVAALNSYKTSVGEFPSTKQGLQALRMRPADLSPTRVWDGPYLNSQEAMLPVKIDMLTDPWGPRTSIACQEPISPMVLTCGRVVPTGADRGMILATGMSQGWATC